MPSMIRLLTVLGALAAAVQVAGGARVSVYQYDREMGHQLWERQVARPINVRQPSPVKPTVAVAAVVNRRVPVRTVAKPLSDADAIIFPTDEPPATTGSSATTAAPGTTNESVPLDVLLDVGTINSVEEFINRYTQQGKPNGITGRSNRTLLTAGVSLRERTISIPFAIQAVCTPQPTTVAFDLENEPYVTYFPACTRLERCGGCCPHHLLECQATKTETVTMQILKTRYLGPGVNKFDIAEPVVVELDKHLECQCQCRVQASHCNLQQVYRPNECRCECLNHAEANACSEAGKLWDAGNCVCRCSEQLQCSSGFIFNKDTCTCTLSRVSRKSPVTRRPIRHPGFRDIDF